MLLYVRVRCVYAYLRVYIFLFLFLSRTCIDRRSRATTLYYIVPSGFFFIEHLTVTRTIQRLSLSFYIFSMHARDIHYYRRTFIYNAKVLVDARVSSAVIRVIWYHIYIYEKPPVKSSKEKKQRVLYTRCVIEEFREITYFPYVYLVKT